MRTFFGLLLFLSVAHADFVEDFNGGWNDPSYTSGTNPSTYTSSTGIWENTNCLINDDKARSGDYVRFDDDLNASLEYKGLDGNGHDGGIDTVSFYYRHWDGDGQTIDFSLQYNIANAGWVTAATGSTSTDTTYQQFSHTLNLASDDIRLRIILTEAPERLLIDDFSLTSGGNAPPPSGISFTSPSATFGEASGTLQIPVTISPAAAGSVSVSVTGGSANTSDYQLNNTSLNFTAGAPTQNISLTLTDDSSIEPDETIVLTLTNAQGASIGSGTYTLTIADNDTPPVSGETITIVSANTTSGNFQRYEGPGDRIFQALDADIIGIQEFNVPGGNLRAWVDATFGTEFDFYIEPGNEQIPNGIVSRYPIIASGEFIDSEVSNRDHAWATVDIPGEIDLHVISVHFLTRGSGVRNSQASSLLSDITSTFPADDYIVICGDFNTDNRNESAINTLKQVFSDDHVPVDQNGNDDTNANRNKPYDWVMPNAALDALHSTYTFGGMTFPDGLVFDTRVWSSSTLPSPALVSDSGASQMQHMAIVKTFTLPDNTPQFAALGTPISWLQDNGYNTNYDAAELLDDDQDGYNTRQEYIANTDPRDPSSRVSSGLVNRNANGSTSITCSTRPDRLYTIEFNDTLTGQWQTFATPTIGQHTSPATPATHTFTDDYGPSTTTTTPVNSRRFYRIRVSVP